MDKPRIVAFYSPYRQSGKSTAAGYIQQATGAMRLSFADPLYSFVSDVGRLMGLHTKYNWISLRNEKKDLPLPELGGASLRDLLIAFGNSAREVYPDIWAECLRGQIHANDGEGWFVIDDMRYPNEMAMLRSEGAKVIRITNPGREIVVAPSETLLEGGVKFDYELVNDKADIDEYHSKIDAMMAELFGANWALSPDDRQAIFPGH